MKTREYERYEPSNVYVVFGENGKGTRQRTEENMVE